MSKINYYDGKKYVEVEVSEELAFEYSQVSQNEKREIWRKKKRKTENSIEEMMELGVDISSDFDISMEYVEQEEISELNAAIKKLLPNQQDLVMRYFFEGQALKEIAKDYCISYQAVQNRLKKILIKLKNYF